MSVAPMSTNIPMAEEKNLFEPVGKKELDRSDFMELFITQLQYQDPMKPMDSYEMASQLAQFSNMEATMKMADNMESLLEYQTSQNNLQLLTLLDTEVQTGGNIIGVTEESSGKGEFTLLEAPDVCQVEIYDAADHLVRVIDVGSVPAGTYDLDWDLNDMSDEQVEPGAYSYVVRAFDLAGQEIEVDYRSTGLVTGIEFDSGRALLTLNGFVSASVSDVSSVVQHTNTDS
ncbi:MAG: flagellar hook assembly protein FlgD [Thermodesulfobacteriota bacterium]|nr:flagellar hook assembly protein FlgD [Thermodesulfobacteriota bacterium]